jgi:hypothetical protein
MQYSDLTENLRILSTSAGQNPSLIQGVVQGVPQSGYPDAQALN